MRCLLLLLLPFWGASASADVEQWSQFEHTLQGPSTGNPFADVRLSATFTLDGGRQLAATQKPAGTCGACAGKKVCSATGRCELPSVIKVDGFYDGNGMYKVRFAPPHVGKWSFVTSSNVPELDGQSGSLQSIAATGSNHGPIESVGYGLSFADGTPHFSVGTTCYQWASMPLAMQKQTLKTLRDGQGKGQVFNKIRMTVFPKWYRNNHQNPVEVGTAYQIKDGSIASDPKNWSCLGGQCPSVKGSFDLERFNVSFWQNYDHLLREMQAMGVIADIIVFHPYDHGHWGFDCMGGDDKDTYNTTHDEFYLRYLTARFSSFSNVWWSMANEWDFNGCKRKGVTGNDGPSPTWDRLFEVLSASDPYGRQAGIHNGGVLYNHSQPWITHVSLQGHEDDTATLRPKYGKPVVWDEVKYEGNISSSWGALSGAEMADRFWWGAAMGAHVGHSETVLHNGVDDDHQPLWWAKGGELAGISPERIRWFRSLWEANTSRPDFATLQPSLEAFGNSNGIVAHMLSKPHIFHALHFLRSGRWTVPLSAVGEGTWQVKHMDYWQMTEKVVKVLPADATEMTVDVTATPYNMELMFVPSFII